MHDYQNKTKAELIEKLRRLQDECDSLKASGKKSNTVKGLEIKGLHEHEILWRTLVNTIPDYIAIHDCDGNFLFLNHYADGFTEEEVLGKNFLDYISNESKDIFSRNFQKCLQTGINQVFEYEAFGDNNVIRSYESCLLPIKEKGKIVNIVSIARDITEHKKSVKELHLHSEIVKNITEGFVLLKLPEEVIVFTNSKFDEMFGYEHGEMVGKHVSVLNAQTDKSPEETKQEIIEIVNRTGEWHGEIMNIKKNGEHFWCYANVSAFEHPDYGRVSLSVHSDITERKRAEEQLRITSIYSRTLIEASLDPLVTINAAGKIMDVNNSTEQITGFNRSNLIGTDFANYFTDSDKARKGYMLVFSKGEVKDYPLTILHSGGRKIDVLYNANLFKNAAGEILGVFATARDVTERKKMEEELRRSKKLLEKLNKHLADIRENERSQIGLNLHDDLGQKLTAINLNLTWIKSRIGVQSKAVRDRIDEIRKIINESIESIREISSFLRPSILFDFGLVPAIRWQMEKFELQSGIKCFFHHEPGEIKIDISVSLILYRVLQESLTNIARHSVATVAEVTLSQVEKKVEMLIKDNGIGIDKEKVNSISSMGIAGIRERVRSVGGSILIKGEKGLWTFIKVSIPVKTRNKDD